MGLQTFIVERDIADVGKFDREQRASRGGGPEESSPAVEWLQSFVSDDKSFCVYRAGSAEEVRRHAERSGFPAIRVTPIRKIIDPKSEMTGPR